MDFDHLEAFVKIVELKSFTKAAESLFLTQPSLSKKIADLERELGLRLIERTKRKVQVTRAGESLLKHARHILSLKRELLNEIKALSHLKKGTIKIGGSNIPGRYILPEILSIYKRKFEGVEVHLIVSDSAEIIKMVSNGEIDVGFVGMKIPYRDIEFRKIIKDNIVVIGSTDYPDIISLNNLKSFPFLSRETGSGTRQIFEEYLKKSKVLSPNELNVIAELSDTEAIKRAVVHGMGLSYVSLLAIHESLANGSIKVIKIEGLPQMERFFYMIRKKGKHSSPQVGAFIETVNIWGINVEK